MLCINFFDFLALLFSFFFFNDTATTEIYTLSLHDALPILVVGSPRGKAKEVNFYDDLHRRYIEVTGAHGNMLFEPAHTRLAGAWDIDKAQTWFRAALHAGRLSLAGLITQRIRPEELGTAYEGLLKKK